MPIETLKQKRTRLLTNERPKWLLVDAGWCTAGKDHLILTALDDGWLKSLYDKIDALNIVSAEYPDTLGAFRAEFYYGATYAVRKTMTNKSFFTAWGAPRAEEDVADNLYHISTLDLHWPNEYLDYNLQVHMMLHARPPVNGSSRSIFSFRYSDRGSIIGESYAVDVRSFDDHVDAARQRIAAGKPQ